MNLWRLFAGLRRRRPAPPQLPAPAEAELPREPEPPHEEESGISPARLDAALERLREEIPARDESPPGGRVSG